MSNATTIEGAIVALLTADAATAALVEARIHPMADPQNIPRPKLTYTRTDTNRSAEAGGFSNNGHTGYALATIQLDAWADAYGIAKQTITAARKCLAGFTGTSAGFAIGCIRIDDEKELPAEINPGQGKPIQRQMMLLKIAYQENQ